MQDWFKNGVRQGRRPGQGLVSWEESLSICWCQVRSTEHSSFSSEGGSASFPPCPPLWQPREVSGETEEGSRVREEPGLVWLKDWCQVVVLAAEDSCHQLTVSSWQWGIEEFPRYSPVGFRVPSAPLLPPFSLECSHDPGAGQGVLGECMMEGALQLLPPRSHDERNHQPFHMLLHLLPQIWQIPRENLSGAKGEPLNKH